MMMPRRERVLMMRPRHAGALLALFDGYFAYSAMLLPRPKKLRLRHATLVITPRLHHFHA